MKAFILSGGKGSRMQSAIAQDLPKPLVHLYNKPIIFWNILSLMRSGFNSFVIAIGYKGNKIIDYLMSNKFKQHLNEFSFTNDKIVIRFSDAGVEADTGERLSYFIKSESKENYLNNFYYFYGDTILLRDISNYVSLEYLENKISSSLLIDMLKIKYGIIRIDQNKKIIYFGENKNNDFINRGGILITKKIIENFYENKYLSFEKDFLPSFVQNHNVTSFNLEGDSVSFDTDLEIYEFEKKNNFNLFLSNIIY